MMFTMPAAMAKEREAAESSASGGAGGTASSSSSSSSAAAVHVGPLPGRLVDAWLDHCAECFSKKLPYATPREYFEAHLRKDPMLDLNGVTIVQCQQMPPPPKKTEEGPEAKSEPEPAPAAIPAGQLDIASTTRVFVRRQYVNGAQVMIGGLGEVCTKEQYRHRGYADLALHRSLNYCRRLQLQLASLHASGDLVTFYQSKHAFEPVPRWFGVKSDFEAEKDVNIVGEGLKHGAFSLRLMPHAQFFSPGLLGQFRSMYTSYSAQFNGPLVRGDEEYWQQWVQSDLQTSLGSRSRFPIEIYAAFEEWDGSGPAVEPFSPIRFLSYMFLQRQHNPKDNGAECRDRVYLVREYACAPQWSDRNGDGGRQMFLSLAQYAVRQIRHKFAEMDAEAAARARLTVKFPLPLTARFAKPLSVDEEVCDPGFMYRPLPLTLAPEVAKQAEFNAEETVRVERRGQEVEFAPIRSPFAATPYVLHHESEPMSESTAGELLEQLKKDAKQKVVFWHTDSF